MDPDEEWSDEPLNLSIKKKPIAVVAPSSGLFNNSSEQSTNTMLLEKISPQYRLHRPFDVSDDEKSKDASEEQQKQSTNVVVIEDDDEDEDRDGRNSDETTDRTRGHQLLKNEEICLDLSKKSTGINRVSNEHDNNKDFILNQQKSAKILYENQQNIWGSVYNNNNGDKFLKEYLMPFLDKKNNESNFLNITNTDTIYSMINHLAEQKLLQALYMNSLFAQQNLITSGGGSGAPAAGSAVYDPLSTAVSSISSNSNSSLAKQQYPILNNLLGSSTNQKIFDNSSNDFFKSKTEALSITVPNSNVLNLQTGGMSATGAISGGTLIKKEKMRSHNKRNSMDQKNNSSSVDSKSNQDSNNASDKKKPHIKKPLNAFMLYMKEMRAKVVAECTLKESAAINQILGRRWHALGREEQAKYYELARRERQLHMQLYPDWSSRANASRGKKRKRKQETNEGGNSMKKCRARYGLEHQSQWCKPCRRKKKCIRYMETGDSNDGNHSDDNLGSCGSVGDAQSPPEDDAESINQSLSSPGGLSGLSSLTSPSMILPSPSTSLASPSVSLASPCMSLQSPLTPHDGTYDIKPIILPTTNSLPPSSQHLNHQSVTTTSSANSLIITNNMDYDVKPIIIPSLPPTSTLTITSHLGNHHQQQQQHVHHPPPHRNPVGTNPHDINNPLSVNQLTGQCIKNSNSGTNSVDTNSTTSAPSNNESARPVISVT